MYKTRTPCPNRCLSVWIYLSCALLFISCSATLKSWDFREGDFCLCYTVTKYLISRLVQEDNLWFGGGSLYQNLLRSSLKCEKFDPHPRTRIEKVLKASVCCEKQSLNQWWRSGFCPQILELVKMFTNPALRDHLSSAFENMKFGSAPSKPEQPLERKDQLRSTKNIRAKFYAKSGVLPKTEGKLIYCKNNTCSSKGNFQTFDIIHHFVHWLMLIQS